MGGESQSGMDWLIPAHSIFGVWRRARQVRLGIARVGGSMFGSACLGPARQARRGVLGGTRQRGVWPGPVWQSRARQASRGLS